MQQDARIARALGVRLDVIEPEMAVCIHERERAYHLTDTLLEEFDDFARARYQLARALWRVEQRLALADFWPEGRREAVA